MSNMSYEVYLELMEAAKYEVKCRQKSVEEAYGAYTWLDHARFGECRGD